MQENNPSSLSPPKLILFDVKGQRAVKIKWIDHWKSFMTPGVREKGKRNVTIKQQHRTSSSTQFFDTVRPVNLAVNLKKIK